MRNILIIMALLAFACKKKEEPKKEEPKCLTHANQECSNGDLSIANKINDTITVRTNVDNKTKKLAPGASYHVATGHISVVYDSDCTKGNASWTGAEITVNGKSSITISVDHCQESWEYRYVIRGTTQYTEWVDVTDYSK